MTQTAVPGRPRVESLLAAAHRNHSVLEQRCAALRRTGIAPEDLPEPTARMAFALLGDHDRAVLTAALRERWGELQSKGLVSGAIDAAIARFVSATSLPITIRRKKNAKTLDLKEIVARLERATDADCAELPTGLAGGLRGAPIALSLRLDGPGQVKPEEALRALFGDDVTVPPVDIVRLGFWRQDGDRVHSPFDATFKSAETATAGHSS